MSTYDGPSLVESMERHSEALWILLNDEAGVIRGVPIYEPVSYRELVVRSYEVVNETHKDGGVYTYRASRTEAEWRADIELDRRRGAPHCQAYPKPLGEFTPRRRLVLEDAEIHAMFGQVAA